MFPVIWRPHTGPLFKILPPPRHAAMGIRPVTRRPLENSIQTTAECQERLSLKNGFVSSGSGQQGLYITVTVLWVTRALQLPLEGFFFFLFSLQMCKTETLGTTNAFCSLNQALMDRCSVFRWCIPWETKPENYPLYVESNNPRIHFALVSHKLQRKWIRNWSNQLYINLSVFPYIRLYLL